jgi:hypothetical protein
VCQTVCYLATRCDNLPISGVYFQLCLLDMSGEIMLLTFTLTLLFTVILFIQQFPHIHILLLGLVYHQAASVFYDCVKLMTSQFIALTIYHKVHFPCLRICECNFSFYLAFDSFFFIKM